MDMDMDIGWCLTCAKRTRDQRSPYCSEACRQADTHPSTPATEAVAITSPLPPKFAALPPSSPLDRRPSGRSIVSKSSDAVLSGMTSPTSPNLASQPRQRDRRAFSFPASEEDERPSLPNFNRKPKAVNATARSFKNRGGYVSPGLRMSTGGTNTPNGDSAIYSTSDSERDEQAIKSPRRPPLSPLASVSVLHPVAPLPMSRVNETAVPTSLATSLSSQLPTARPSLEARTASPVARMGSSSSRSREDIISWARGVDARGDTSTVRSSKGRGRRPEALANLTPPSTEPLDEPHGSTPRSANALSALNMTFAPVVNALRNVSLGSSPAPDSPSLLGLPACQASTSLSRIDVVVGTRNTDELAFAEGCTPTLSTISLSEAFDPSNATDVGETIESATDGFSVSSSHYRTPPVAPTTIRAEPPSRRKSGLPLRPPSLQQTASAIWSFSSYLRSFAPFTTPFSLVSTSSSPAKPESSMAAPTIESEASTLIQTPALGLDLGTATAAVPAGPRSEPDEVEIDPAHDLVRSVPMDIVIAAGSKAQAITEERAREREVIEYLGSRSRSCSRERARMQKCARETSDCERSDEGARGRRRNRRRGDRSEPDTPEEPEEEERGRRRARGGESRDRSWSAARGRTSRTRAAVRA